MHGQCIPLHNLCWLKVRLYTISVFIAESKGFANSSYLSPFRGIDHVRWILFRLRRVLKCQISLSEIERRSSFFVSQKFTTNAVLKEKVVQDKARRERSWKQHLWDVRDHWLVVRVMAYFFLAEGTPKHTCVHFGLSSWVIVIIDGLRYFKIRARLR